MTIVLFLGLYSDMYPVLCRHIHVGNPNHAGNVQGSSCGRVLRPAWWRGGRRWNRAAGGDVLQEWCTSAQIRRISASLFVGQNVTWRLQSFRRRYRSVSSGQNPARRWTSSWRPAPGLCAVTESLTRAFSWREETISWLWTRHWTRSSSSTWESGAGTATTFGYLIAVSPICIASSVHCFISPLVHLLSLCHLISPASVVSSLPFSPHRCYCWLDFLRLKNFCKNLWRLCNHCNALQSFFYREYSQKFAQNFLANKFQSTVPLPQVWRTDGNYLYYRVYESSNDRCNEERPGGKLLYFTSATWHVYVSHRHISYISLQSLIIADGHRMPTGTSRIRMLAAGLRRVAWLLWQTLG